MELERYTYYSVKNRIKILKYLNKIKKNCLRRCWRSAARRQYPLMIAPSRKIRASPLTCVFVSRCYGRSVCIRLSHGLLSPDSYWTRWPHGRSLRTASDDLNTQIMSNLVWAVVSFCLRFASSCLGRGHARGQSHFHSPTHEGAIQSNCEEISALFTRKKNDLWSKSLHWYCLVPDESS